jgi:hypothetical protein
MDDITPLGSLDAFKRWFTPRPWGGEGWRATFGPAVVADLVKGLRDHPAAVKLRFPAKAEAYPVVLGCVNLLTSKEVVDALLSMMADPPPSFTGFWPGASSCVIVDKAAYAFPHQLDRLSREGVGVQQALLRDIEYWGRPEGGRPPVITPNTIQDRELEPVRVVGWKKANNKKAPMLHAKLAVCCAAYTWEGEMGGWNDHLLPMSVWMGSANWTALSSSHLEFGAWTTDKALAEAALQFMTDVIKVSEPWGSEAERPSPELVAANWDDEAFAELWSELRDGSDEE